MNVGGEQAHLFLNCFSGKLTAGEAWLPLNQPSNLTFLPTAE